MNVGNSKFGVITIEKLAEGEQSSLKYTVFIDGVERWDTIVLSPTALQQTAKVGGGSFWDRLRGIS